MGLFDIFRRRPAAPIVTHGPGASAVWTAARNRAGAGAAQGARGWLGAQPSRLLADLPGGAAAAPNRDIRQQLAVLRARSRWLAQNDGYTQGFLRMLRRNVVGPTGFGLQMRVPNDRGTGQDTNANDRIEAAWKEWSGHGACDVTGRLSMTAILRLAVTGLPRDGEFFLRLHRTRRWSRFGLTVEVLDPAQLDETLNGRPAAGLPDGNVVRTGVEIDRYGRTAAYWFRPSVPNDDPAAARSLAVRPVRIPAEEILHFFMAEWPHQLRGVPWTAAGIRTLAMLDGYSEAELTAARISAGKMGFYKQADAEDVDAELQQDGTLVQEATAGAFELLPKGVEVEAFDPQHPNAAFKDFVGACLRSAAAGAGVSYNAFANDAEGMNYSALRATEIEDRDEFRTIQHAMVEGLVQPLFAAWLTESLLNDALAGLPASKAWKFNRAEFQPRGWDWVDPQKEIAAAREAVALGIKSRRMIAAAQGIDLDKVVEDLRAEQALFAGITPPGAAGPAPPPDIPES